MRRAIFDQFLTSVVSCNSVIGRHSETGMPRMTAVDERSLEEDSIVIEEYKVSVNSS